MEYFGRCNLALQIHAEFFGQQVVVLFDDKEGGRSIECGGECTPHVTKMIRFISLCHAKNSAHKHSNALS